MLVFSGDGAGTPAIHVATFVASQSRNVVGMPRRALAACGDPRPTWNRSRHPERTDLDLRIRHFVPWYPMTSNPWAAALDSDGVLPSSWARNDSTVAALKSGSVARFWLISSRVVRVLQQLLAPPRPRGSCFAWLRKPEIMAISAPFPRPAATSCNSLISA